MKWFCRWIFVCFVCAHESSYIYLHVCAKAPCLDDNPVLSSTFISVYLRPYHSNHPVSPDRTCYRVMLPVKVFRTQVYMSSRNSVQNHWHFEYYSQSLCLPVLDVVRNRTKIVPWSLPMSLFLWSTVWYSLLILRMSCPATADALNSWPSRLWYHNSSPPPSSNPHYVSWENQVIWLSNWMFVRHEVYTTVLRPLVLSWLIPSWETWKKVERRKLRGRHVLWNPLYTDTNIKYWLWFYYIRIKKGESQG